MEIKNSLDRYDAVRDTIKTGDTLAFSGKGFISDTIKDVTHSSYSHVGVAMWGIQPGTDKERLFLLESTTLSTTKGIDGEYRKGVQLTLMAQRLESYEGKVWLFSLKNNLTDDQRLAASDWAFQRYTKKTPYDSQDAIKSGVDCEKLPWYVRWITAPFARLFQARVDDSRLFCSELNTEFYKHAGILPSSVNSAEMTPADVVQFALLLQPPVELI